MAGVRLIRAEERKRQTAQTPGLTREEAFSEGPVWSGLAHTAAGMTSGWHHHGDYDTVIYVVSGALGMQSGAGGKERVDAKPGDFVIVPKRTIHRESNPSKEESEIVLVRIGSGPPVVNADGPGDE
jgi:uncharacterized RmlC-like cupin family protein